MGLVNFRELSEANQDGQGLEALARLLGLAKNMEVEWSGFGADAGKDLIFTDVQKGVLNECAVRWFVQCKDNSKSQRAVSEKDLGEILDKLVQHRCAAYLLVTTTRVTSGLKQKLDNLAKPTMVWDEPELSQMLLKPENDQLLLQFFPESYAKRSQIKDSISAFKQRASRGISAASDERWKTLFLEELVISDTAVEIEFPDFEPTRGAIEEIDIFSRAYAVNLLHDLRRSKIIDFDPFDDFEKKESLPPSSFYTAEYWVPYYDSELLSVVFFFTQYGSGAAHPNHFTETFSFSLSPAYRLRLDTILDGDYLQNLSTICSNAIIRKKTGYLVSPDSAEPEGRYDRFVEAIAMDSDPKPIDDDEVLKGTSQDQSNFEKFFLNENGITFIFDEYSVDCYVAGAYRVMIPYAMIAEFINPRTAAWALFQASMHQSFPD